MYLGKSFSFPTLMREAFHLLPYFFSLSEPATNTHQVEEFIFEHRVHLQDPAPTPLFIPLSHFDFAIMATSSPESPHKDCSYMAHHLPAPVHLADPGLPLQWSYLVNDVVFLAPLLGEHGIFLVACPDLEIGVVHVTRVF